MKNNITVDNMKAERELLISSLKSGTVYLFQVSAMNRYGAGSKTQPLSVRTVYVPTTPGNISPKSFGIPLFSVYLLNHCFV